MPKPKITLGMSKVEAKELAVYLRRNCTSIHLSRLLYKLEAEMQMAEENEGRANREESIVGQ